MKTTREGCKLNLPTYDTEEKLKKLKKTRPNGNARERTKTDRVKNECQDIFYSNLHETTITNKLLDAV